MQEFAWIKFLEVIWILNRLNIEIVRMSTFKIKSYGYFSIYGLCIKQNGNGHQENMWTSKTIHEMAISKKLYNWLMQIMKHMNSGVQLYS